MKQVTVNIRNQDLSSSLVGSDAKNALSTNTSYDWTEFVGLSWIFKDDSMENYA